MRVLLLVGLLAVTAACGAYSFPSSSTSTSYGTVTGHVTALPCSPVENPDGPCKARPAGGVDIDFSSDQGGPFLTRTGADGSFTIGLPGGVWKVTLKTMRVISGPSSVTVQAGATVVADYVVDSRIRMPVPGTA